MWIKITVLCTIIVILTEIEANPQEKNSLHKNKRTAVQYSISHQSSRTYGANPENRSIKIQHQPAIIYAESRRDSAADAPKVSIVPTPTPDDGSQKDQKEEGSHDVEHVAEPEHHHHTKIIERPIYIREPEPIIEIIIKESNVSLPPPPKIHIPIPKRKKEQVQVFYVKYRKNPHGHGKDSVIYDKPIPAISPPIHDEEPEEPQQPYHYEETVTSPPLPKTTLRTIIKPDSETYHSPSGVKVTFGKEGFDYKKRSNNPEDIKRDFGPTGPREFGPTGPREFGPSGPREFGATGGPRSPPYFPRGGEIQSFQQNFQFSNNYQPRENYRPEPQRHSQTERPFLAGIPQFGRKIPFNGQISSQFQQESRFPPSDDQPYKFVKSPPRFNSQPQFSSFQQPFFDQSSHPQYSSNQSPSFPVRKPVAYKPFNFPQPQSPKNIQFRPHERFPTQELNFPAQLNSQQFAQNNYPNFGQQHHQSRGLAHNSQAPAPVSFNNNNNHQPQIHHQPNIQNFNPYENTGPRRPLPPQPQQYNVNLQQNQQNFPQHPQYTQPQQIPPQPLRNDYNDDKPKLLPSISKYEQHIADSPLQPSLQAQKEQNTPYQNGDTIYYNTPPTPTKTTTQNYNKQYQKQPSVVVQNRPSDSPKKLTLSNQSQKSNTYKGYKSETRYSTQSTTPKYTYSKSISTTTFAPTSPPTQRTTTKDPKVLEAQLPDEVPEDLRQQLLSSGILNNADISVLDYDKVGDIPLSALPPDQLANFYSAGGAQQISAASAPIPSIVKKEDQVDQQMAGSEVNEVKVKPNVEMKVVKFDPQTNEGKQIQDSYLQNGAKQSEPVVLNDEGYNKYLPIKVSGAQFPIPDVPELREKKITSVVILAPIRYDFSSQSKREVKKSGKDSNADVVPLELDQLLRNPTSENYEKFLSKQKETKNEEQAIILLVTGPQSKDQREIFMYDVASKNVNKLEGELSSLFVEAAENNIYFPKANQKTESVKGSH